MPGCFEGTLTFALDGRCRSSAFELRYGEEGYDPVKVEFDPFQLTKLQKDVSRYLGGYLAKEWETNGPSKSARFEKQRARALVADVHQQENLNDCGVYVLENTLRAMTLKKDFLLTMAEASADVLKSYPWPTQKDITARKLKLKGIVARLFAAAAEKGCSDVEKLIKEDSQLREEVLSSLVNEREGEVDKWSENLQKELAARQVDKEKGEEEKRRREEVVQARRDEERRRREEAERAKEQERLKVKREGPARTKKKGSSASGSSMSRSSRSRSRGKDKKRPQKKKGARSPSRGSDSEDSRRPAAKAGKKSKGNNGAAKGKRARGPSSSRSASPSSAAARRRKKR